MRLAMIPRVLLVLASAFAAVGGSARPSAQPAPLPTPGFHHLHLNSVNPEAAVAFYAAQFPSTSASTFAGLPALRSPNDVWVLFNKIDAPPATQPPTAFWHFGWHVTDVRASLARYQQRGVTLLPLYTGDMNGTVFVSSDTWLASGGALGLTAAGIAEAKAKGIRPAGGAGFAYLRGPDDALVEYQGNMPAERVQTTTFGDVSFFFYMNQGDTPAVSTRGQLMDHVALSVSDLDAWLGKLRAAGVALLGPSYVVGSLRAVMIEGPSREVIELIEVR